MPLEDPNILMSFFLTLTFFRFPTTAGANTWQNPCHSYQQTSGDNFHTKIILDRERSSFFSPKQSRRVKNKIMQLKKRRRNWGRERKKHWRTNVPNPTAVNKQSKTSCLFTGKSMRNDVRKEGTVNDSMDNSYRKTGSMMTAIKEACKAANRQITDPIAVS